MSDFLLKIAAIQKRRIEAAQQIIAPSALEALIQKQAAPRGYQKALLQKKPGIIAEVKFASPSAGRIYHGIQTQTQIASAYLDAGAACLSVLTEPDYFQGSPEVFSKIRSHLPAACMLRKDFIIDPYQILEARAWGADAILLIVAMLDDQTLLSMHDLACILGMDVLVEVHDAAELERAHHLGASFIGINNRNLRTLEIDVSTSRLLAAQFKRDVIYVSESGIEDAATIKDLQSYGYKGFLMGSHFMRHHHPGSALADLVQECQ